MRWCVVTAACLAAIVAIGFWADVPRYWASNAQLLRNVEEALRTGRAARAESLCQVLLQRTPDARPVLRLASEAASRRGNQRAALNYLERFSDDGAAMADDCVRCAQLALELGELAKTERYCRQALARNSRQVDAAQKLVFLLRVEGRNAEAAPLIRSLLRSGEPMPDGLYVLGMPDWVWLDARETQFLSFCRQSTPGDFLPELGLLRQEMLRGDFRRALPSLPRIVQKHPNMIGAQVALGEALLHNERPDEFLAWLQQLPPQADDDAQVWFLRGWWLNRQGKFPSAIRCFGEALCRNPDHRAANYQLSQLLREGPESSAAGLLVERASRLSRVEYLVREVQVTPALMGELVEVLESLGRPWEARGWAQQALRQNAAAVWAKAAIERLEPLIAQQPPTPPATDLPCGLVQWDAYPLPRDADFSVSSETAPTIADDAPDGAIRFEDSAESAGIRFRYDRGADPQSGRVRMFEFSGGGVAVLDYDVDGWPDIHLTQGGRWPSVSGPRAAADRLFRHGGNDTFRDVTSAADVGDERFSQGVTAGDYDNDGFPDLYVANIGANRFFHNNGDGTFRDVTEATGTGGNAWSLSCALADLNGDGLPDLYVVNYLAGDVLERACQSKGRPVQCFPTSFPAEQDRLYLNLGNGQFRDVTATSGIEVADGKGMGLAIADFDDSRRPGIFIANDTTANFLFRNQTQTAGASPNFLETGLLAGVALSERGQAQSSMGVAIGDANGDGRLDLFVTNYLRESSNLYVQQADHSFVDEAASSGLREPGFDLMKWGAQFLDADLDGHLDLVVANGHLDDYSADGVPYTMPTQCYRNLGGGRFRVLPAGRLGPYFQRLLLGRAIARCDWNRDGRDDVCITHVDAPFALLTNRTAPTGHFLKLRLRGVQSSRDAATASVRVLVGGRVLVRQLTAGDGFQASNERQILVGLGASERADSVTVVWPAGETQVFDNLPGDREWLLTEGSPTPLAQHVVRAAP